MVVLQIAESTQAEDIGLLAEQRLRQSPYFFLKNVTCDFQDGVLTVRGRVPMTRLRNFAESIVSKVDGVEKVVNEIEVIDPMRPTFGSSNGSPGLRSAG